LIKLSANAWKDKKAHVRRLSNGKKIRVKAHKQRYNIKGGVVIASPSMDEKEFINLTKANLKRIENEIKGSRQNKRLFVARHKAAHQVMTLRGKINADDFYEDMKDDNAPVGFIADDTHWNNWLNSLGRKGDIVNIDASNVLKGYTIPEPWWQWQRTSKSGRKYMLTILKHSRKDRPNHKYNSWELKVGTRIEMEHTNDPVLAEIIAKDHLDEYPDYYTHLVKLENRLEIRKKVKKRNKKKKREAAFGTGIFLDSKKGKKKQRRSFFGSGIFLDSRPGRR
jgi:hypothetical protein